MRLKKAVEMRAMGCAIEEANHEEENKIITRMGYENEGKLKGENKNGRREEWNNVAKDLKQTKR